MPPSPVAGTGMWALPEEPAHQQHQQQQGSSGAGSACTPEPLHAYYQDMLLVQVGDVTVASPGMPQLLCQAHAGLHAEAWAHPGWELPPWMQHDAAVQRMMANSNAILASASPPPAPATAQQHQAPSAANGGGDGAVAVPGAAAAEPDQQQAAPSSQPAAAEVAVASSSQPGSIVAHAHTAAATGAAPTSSSSSVAVTTLRHGVLLVDDGAEFELAPANGEPLTAAALAAAARGVLRRALLKVWPQRRRRLVIRPDDDAAEAEAADMVAAEQGAAGTAGGGARGGGGAGQQRRGQRGHGPAGSQQGGGAAGAGAALCCAAAHLLVDMQGLELLAGEMLRERATSYWVRRSNKCAGSAFACAGVLLMCTRARQQHHCCCHLVRAVAAAAQGAPSGSEAARLEASLAPPGRCSLRGLTHVIAPTSLQAAMHEHRPATCAAPQPHLSPPPRPASVLALATQDGLSLQLSGHSYAAFMDTLYGNIMQHVNSFEPAAAPASLQAQRTLFHPGLQFGPRPGQLLGFGITLSSSAVQVRELQRRQHAGLARACLCCSGAASAAGWRLMQAHAQSLTSMYARLRCVHQATLLSDHRWWTVVPPAPDSPSWPASSAGGAGVSGDGGQGSPAAAAAGKVVPVASAVLREAGLCVQMMQGSSDVYTNVWATDTEWLDVRMGQVAEAASSRGSSVSGSNSGSAGSGASGGGGASPAPSAASDDAFEAGGGGDGGRMLSPFAEAAGGALASDAGDAAASFTAAMRDARCGLPARAGAAAHPLRPRPAPDPCLLPFGACLLPGW